LFVDSCLMLARQVKYQVKTEYIYTYLQILYKMCPLCTTNYNTVAVRNLLAVSKRYRRLLVQCKLSKGGENKNESSLPLPGMVPQSSSQSLY